MAGAGTGARRSAPAALRNAGPILEVLRAHLPAAGAGGGGPGAEVLEVASGTGQHAAHFGAALPGARFQPSELSAEAFPSISAWSEGLANVAEPVQLDAAAAPAEWPVAGRRFDVVLCCNLTHISPWESTQGLLRGAGAVLGAGGKLLLYGPFAVDGEPTTESNAAFDRSLRERDPRWGYRDVADVCREAEDQLLFLLEQRHMPANNFTLVFERRAAGGGGASGEGGRDI